jgi:membrane protein implicated in regulation of membrane protease activity
LKKGNCGILKKRSETKISKLAFMAALALVYWSVMERSINERNKRAEGSNCKEVQTMLIMMLFMFSPILGLALFFIFPFWTAFPIYIPILLFGAFVNFKMMESMKLKVQTGSEGLMGKEAVVLEDINPEGKVEIMDEIWKATAKGKTFQKGKKVKITGTQGLVLTVDDLQKRSSDKGQAFFTALHRISKASNSTCQIEKSRW